MFSDTFSSTFIGQLVEVVCREKGLDGYPLLVQGYLLDVDEEYVYFGQNPLEIAVALKREMIGLISIMEEIDPHEAMLRDMPTPGNPEEAQ